MIEALHIVLMTFGLLAVLWLIAWALLRALRGRRTLLQGLIRGVYHAAEWLRCVATGMDVGYDRYRGSWSDARIEPVNERRLAEAKPELVKTSVGGASARPARRAERG